MDIKDSMDFTTGFSIIEEHGFNPIFDHEYASKLNRDDSLRCIIFFNEKTHDYCVIGGAMDDNICYAGADLYLHRTLPDVHNTIAQIRKSTSTKHDGQPGYCLHYTYHEGLFHAWDALEQYVDERGYDWQKIGFGCAGIPIPTYINLLYLNPVEMREKLDVEAYKLMSKTLSDYNLELIINTVLMICDEDLVKKHVRYALGKDWFLNGGFLKMAGWYSGRNDDAATLVKIAFDYLQVPKDWIGSCIKSGREYFSIRNEADGFMDSAHLLEQDCKISHNVLDGYKLPPIEQLPVKLRWM